MLILPSAKSRERPDGPISDFLLACLWRVRGVLRGARWYIRLVPAVLFLCHSLFAAEMAPVPVPAHAAQKKAMLQAMREYFHEEKTAAKLAVFGSAIAGGSGVYLMTQSDLGRGAGYSLLGVAAIGLAVGGGVYFRTNSQLRRLEDQLDQAPLDYKREESERMARVNAQFRILKIAEYSILGIGVATTVTGALKQADLTTGVGIGLIFDAGLLLLFDYFAETRAHVYAQRITEFGAVARTVDIIQGLSFDYRF